MPIENAENLDTGEVSLIFTVNLSGSEKEQYQIFCGLGTIFDDITRTFSINDSYEGRDIIINTSGPIISRILYLILIGYLIFFSNLDFFSGLTIISICSFLAGVILYDIYSLTISSVYRQFNWKFQSVQDQLSESDYERISAGTLNGIFTFPAGIMTNLIPAVALLPKYYKKGSIFILAFVLVFLLIFSNLLSMNIELRKTFIIFLSLISGWMYGYFFVKKQILVLSKGRVEF